MVPAAATGFLAVVFIVGAHLIPRQSVALAVMGFFVVVPPFVFLAATAGEMDYPYPGSPDFENACPSDVPDWWPAFLPR
jgi:hypothetical protein